MSGILQAVTDGYLRYFQTTAAFGALLFGATFFLMLRGMRLVNDNDFVTVKNLWLVTLAGLFSVAVILTGFIAQNTLLAFHTEFLRGESFATSLCAIRDDVTTFFLECYRQDMRVLVWINLGSIGGALLSLAAWFFFQIRGPAHEK
jgi:hypothetical protein